MPSTGKININKPKCLCLQHPKVNIIKLNTPETLPLQGAEHLELILPQHDFHHMTQLDIITARTMKFLHNVYRLN